MKQLKCPTCESTLVIETDEISTLDAESDVSEDSSECMIKNQHSENTMKTNLQHSESFSSIGKLYFNTCMLYFNQVNPRMIKIFYMLLLTNVQLLVID